MLSYEECKKIAQEKASGFQIELDTAYTIGNDFVFDDSMMDCAGHFPVVVSSENGVCSGLWLYLNKYDMSMDDMEIIAF